jgi:hypothetical protein
MQKMQNYYYIASMPIACKDQAPSSFYKLTTWSRVLEKMTVALQVKISYLL